MAYEPYVCLLTHSRCYNKTTKMTVKGVLWHSTGANNPTLKRYVQPYEGDPNYDEAIAKLGYNRNRNDWNHQKNSVGVNAFIGKFADGSVGTVQTLPWDYSPWGCASGKNGSCNNGWIQFEICEDDLKNKEYAQAVWDEAIELTVYLCKMYGLDPSKMAKCGKASVPVITCHNDASKAGCASGHADINHWFPKILGKNMDNARSEVYARLVNEGVLGVTTAPAPATESVTTPTQIGVFGIDVSKWQNGLKLKDAKTEGVNFAILKIGGSNDGRYKDPCFESFYNQAMTTSMPVGAYYVAGDYSVSDATKSADHLIGLLSGHRFPYPIYYDVERDMLTKNSQKDLCAIVLAFCQRVEKAGYWVGIYASESTFKALLTDNALKHYCWWVAAWRESRPTIGDMWQFGGESNLIRSNKICGMICDQDCCYVDYPTKIKAKKLNGYGVATAPAVASPIVKHDSKGANAKLLQQNLNKFGYKLAEDGIFGNASVAALKAWQAKYGLVADGIYGQKSYAKMRSLVV